MSALLDVNVLIALFDSDHTSHAVAFGWFEEHAGEGWASCPITQNGCIRIMANPSYPNTLPIQSVMNRLADACKADAHEFWSDDVSLLGPEYLRFDPDPWPSATHGCLPACPCGTPRRKIRNFRHRYSSDGGTESEGPTPGSVVVGRRNLSS